MVAAFGDKEVTLWSAKICPWAQRVTLAVEELNIDHKHEEIDLMNKPSWYAERINPASKVPVLQIGEDVKIPESGVLLELLADLSSRSPDMPSLLPEDAVARAQQRYFIERFKELITPAFYALVYKQDAAAKEKLLNGLREVQTLMTKAPGKFFASDEQPQIADLAVIPHLARLLVLAREPDAAELMSPELAQAIASSDEFKPTREYADLMMARPSFKATFDKEYILSKTRERIAAARASA